MNRLILNFIIFVLSYPLLGQSTSKLTRIEQIYDTQRIAPQYDEIIKTLSNDLSQWDCSTNQAVKKDVKKLCTFDNFCKVLERSNDRALLYKNDKNKVVYNFRLQQIHSQIENCKKNKKSTNSSYNDWVNFEIGSESNESAYKTFRKVQKSLKDILRSKLSSDINKNNILNNMMRKLDSIELIKDEFQIRRFCTRPTAGYNAEHNLFLICPQILTMPKTGLELVIAHELAHSIDPIIMELDEKGPFDDIIACLQEEKALGADPHQIGEGFSDWLGTEYVASELKKTKKKQRLQKAYEAGLPLLGRSCLRKKDQQSIKAVKTLIEMKCIPSDTNIDHFIRKIDRNLEGKEDEHNHDVDRLEKVLISHPVIKKSLKCSKNDGGKYYG